MCPYNLGKHSLLIIGTGILTCSSYWKRWKQYGAVDSTLSKTYRKIPEKQNGCLVDGPIMDCDPNIEDGLCVPSGELT